jgi:hypothetical protein
MNKYSSYKDSEIKWLDQIPSNWERSRIRMVGNLYGGLSGKKGDDFNREVKPHLPNSWIDFDKSKVGYEINFTKYFYNYKPLRGLTDITQDLLELEKESELLLNQIID